MSRPEAASEPSMDDILASIRKIIAEEPAAVRAPPEPRTAAAAPAPETSTQSVLASPAAAAPATSASAFAATPSVSPASEPAPATLTRALSGLSTSPAAAAKPIAAPVGSAAFDDLDDLLEAAPESPLRPVASTKPAEPAAEKSSKPLPFGNPFARAPGSEPALPSAAPAPERNSLRAGAEAPLSFDQLLRAKPVPAGAQPNAKLDLDAAPAPAALGDLGAVVPSHAGFGAPAGESRREGARAEPASAAATLQSAKAADPFKWTGPKLEQAAATPSAAAPSFGAPELKSAPQAEPAKPAAPAVDSKAEPDEPQRYEVIAAMPTPATGASPAAAAKAGADQVAAAQVATAQVATGEIRPAPAIGIAESPATLVPAAVSDAFPPLGPDTGTEETEAGFEAAAIESTAAAASALGALAAGLAASSKSIMPAPVPETAPAVAEAVVAATVIAPAAAEAPPRARMSDAIPSIAAAPVAIAHPAAPIVNVAAPQPLASPVASMPVANTPPPAPAAPVAETSAATGAAPVRSLDDTVADLLRPMLRQWLAENMPRIVEKALRIEVAESVRSTASQSPKSD